MQLDKLNQTELKILKKEIFNTVKNELEARMPSLEEIKRELENKLSEDEDFKEIISNKRRIEELNNEINRLQSLSRITERHREILRKKYGINFGNYSYFHADYQMYAKSILDNSKPKDEVIRHKIDWTFLNKKYDDLELNGIIEAILKEF